MLFNVLFNPVIMYLICTKSIINKQYTNRSRNYNSFPYSLPFFKPICFILRSTVTQSTCLSFHGPSGISWDSCIVYYWHVFIMASWYFAIENISLSLNLLWVMFFEYLSHITELGGAREGKLVVLSSCNKDYLLEPIPSSFKFK